MRAADSPLARPLSAIVAGFVAITLSVALAVPAQAAPVAQAAAVDNGRPKPEKPSNGNYAGLSDDAKAALQRSGTSQEKFDSDAVEDVSARTEKSRTRVDPATGTRITELSTQALNFKTAKGEWEPIDTTLVPISSKQGASDGWTTTAAGYDATVPRDLTQPLRFADAAHPDQWVSLLFTPVAPVAAPPAEVVPEPETTQPPAEEVAPDEEVPSDEVPSDDAPSESDAPTDDGATIAPAGVDPDGSGSLVSDAAGETDGNKITYDDVLPGTDVALQAQSGGVKETVTLDSLDALAATGGTLTYTVTLGEGLKLVESDDTVTVVNAAGDTVFVIPAPFMDDAAGERSDAIDVALSDANGGYVMTVTPDAEWLASADRVWPVVIDPTIGYPSTILGCAISSSAPTTTSCSGGEIPLSWNSSGGAQKRGLLTFPTLFDVIPADAQIAQAQLQVQVVQVGGTTATDVDVKELSAEFASGATWNTRDGSNAWGTAGGDRGAAIARASINPSVGGGFSFDVADTVQRWIEGTSDYYGFELEKNAAASGGKPVRLTQANDTSLYIEWDPRVGDRKGNVALVTEKLSDATTVTINPATGNAMVTTRQLTIAGLGLDLNVAHTSNSVGTPRYGVYGDRWQDSLNVGLQPYAGSLFYVDGSGAQWTFYKALDGSWIRPTGLDADLVESSGTFTLTDRKTRIVSTFTDIGDTGDPFYGVQSVEDRNGNEITFTYDSSDRLPYNGHLILRQVTDTRGRDLDITNFGYWNAWLTDVENREPSVNVNGSNLLESETNAAGGTIAYEYDGDARVTAITVPEGQRTELTYDGDGRVLTLTRLDGISDPTWTFSYGMFDRSSGVPALATTVTDPNGHNSEYTSDGRGRVGTVENALGKEVVNTFTANDDQETSTGATAGGSGPQTYTNEYDSSGASASAATWNLSSSRLPTGSGISNTYGAGATLYDMMSSTDARGNTTNYAYDSDGNRTSVTEGGLTTKYLYQGNTDPDYSGTVNCGPTVMGVVTATKAGVLCETRDGAYVAGASALATTAHRIAYRYDADGQLVTMLPGTPSAQVQQTFVYDSLSRLAEITDGRGQTTFYGYDSMDRLVYTLYQDGRVVSHYFGDEWGNGWLRAIDEYPPSSGTPDRHTDYSRDDLGRLRATVSPEDTINLNYDDKGNLIEYIDGGGTVEYGYNDADQLTSLALPGGTCAGQSLGSPGAASTLCVLFGVDDDGRRTMTRYPGGQTLAATLDDAGRLQQVVGTTLAGSTSTQRLNLDYVYADPGIPSDPANPNDDTSLVTSVIDALTSKTTSYTYDGLDRLSVASTAPTGGGSITYYEGFCYDDAGNRTKYLNSSATTCSSGSPAATFTYNGGNELTAATGVTPTGASIAGSSFTYDGNGNQTGAKSAIGLTTTYGAQEQAASFTPSGGSAINQSYASGSGGNIERTASGSTSFAVSPLSPAPAWSETSGTSKWTVRDPQGTLIAVRIGTNASTATAYYPFTDKVDSVRAMVKADGTLSNTYSYSAYGVTLALSEAATQPFRFGGGYSDVSTGLVKLGHRYYDPAQGRFTQQDPSGQEANPYAYASCSPVSANDPSGLSGDYEYVCQNADGTSWSMAAGQPTSDCNGTYLQTYIDGSLVSTESLAYGSEGGPGGNVSWGCTVAVGSAIAVGVWTPPSVLAWIVVGGGAAYGLQSECPGEGY
jgi:RHS repeat-associated protein